MGFPSIESVSSNKAAFKFILVGPPGAGKGTVAGELRAAGLEHVSSGDVLRHEVERNTPLGASIRKRLELGEFVPDAEILQLMRKWFWSRKPSRGFVLDGFPRTLLQARSFDEWMEARAETLDGCLMLELSEDRAVERIAGRRVCPRDGTVYHETHQPPQRAGVCDLCGGKLVRRPDDEEEVVRRRFALYRETTRPVEKYYRDMGLLYVFSGEEPPAETARSMLAFFSGRRSSDGTEGKIN